MNGCRIAELERGKDGGGGGSAFLPLGYMLRRSTRTGDTLAFGI